MTRRESRIQAFQLLFCADFRRDEPIAQIFRTEEDAASEEWNDYIKAVYFGVQEKKEEIDALICENANGWKLTRLARVTLALLRLATYEMLYVEDVPYEAAINEALELAKVYDDEKSVAFINGVLNAIATKKGLKEA
jgi:N utilization substance protein B